jgi:hypothetical protein
MARRDKAGRPRSRPSSIALALIALALILPAGASAAVPRSFFGVSAVLPSDNDMQRMGDGGLGAYRLPINWRSVQRTRKGDYRWGAPDADFLRAVRNGIIVTPFLYGTPRFISKSSSKVVPPTGSAEDLKLWSDFAAAATRRYGPGGDFWLSNPYAPMIPVRKWIIWNEQNARPFWYPRADPEDYAKLVKVSDEAISSVDPDARISLGGIYGYPHDPRSMSAVHFLKAFYRVPGIRRHFEIVDLHPYGSGIGTVRKQIKQARGVMRRSDDRDAAVLIGEIGWATHGPKRSASVVGTKGQDNRIKKGMKLLLQRRDRWNINAAYVYVWRDFSTANPCQWCPGAGLIQEDGDPKPSWLTLKDIIRRNT